MLQPTITRTKVHHLVDLLPETLLAEVARFIEFILFYFRADSAPRKIEADAQKINSAIRQPRIPNLHPNSAWISDDFDDPLPDEFWLGEPDETIRVVPK